MLKKVSKLVAAVRHRIRMSRYDDFTIAEYFRELGARIGPDCRLQVRSLGAEPYLISIGRHVTLSTNVDLVTHDGAAWLFADEDPSIQKFGPIKIGDNCFIGAGSIVMPGVTVGNNCVVGAGSIVTRDIADNTVVAGCPARRICSLEEYRSKVFATWREQKPPGYFEALPAGKEYAASTVQAQKLAEYAKLKRHLTGYFGLE